MDAKTLKALKASIAKWEMNATTARTSCASNSYIMVGEFSEDGVIGMGDEGCPLCGLFFKKSCRGCPISQKTKQIGCNGTPFRDVDDLAPVDGVFIASEALVAACEAEVAFLRSLLPAEG